MKTTLKKENGTLTIVISGRLDTVTSMDLKQKLDEIGFENIDIDIDFEDVEYISSAGLRLVLALQKQTKSTDNNMVIRNVNKVVSEIFAVAGFNKVLNII